MLCLFSAGSEEDAYKLINSGGVPFLKQLLSSSSPFIQEKALVALGNIALTSASCRDYILQIDTIPETIRLVSEDSLPMMRLVTWAWSVMCASALPPAWDLISPIVPKLAMLLYCTDEETLINTCATLSYLSNGDNDRIRELIHAGICRRLVELLLHPNYQVEIHVLTATVNITSGTTIQTQVLLNVSLLPCLLCLLSSPKKGIRKRALWATSNVAAGSREQVQAIIDTNIFPSLVTVLRHSEYDLQKQALWAVHNLALNGIHYQIDYMIVNEMIPPLCNFLKCKDAKMVLLALETLYQALKAGKEKERSCNDITACDAWPSIELLRSHESSVISECAAKILKEFHTVEEMEEETLFSPPKKSTRNHSPIRTRSQKGKQLQQLQHPPQLMSEAWEGEIESLEELPPPMQPSPIGKRKRDPENYDPVNIKSK